MVWNATKAEVTNNQSWFMPSDQIVIKIQETLNQSIKSKHNNYQKWKHFSNSEDKSFLISSSSKGMRKKGKFGSVNGLKDLCRKCEIRKWKKIYRAKYYTKWQLFYILTALQKVTLWVFFIAQRQTGFLNGQL